MVFLESVIVGPSIDNHIFFKLVTLKYHFAAGANDEISSFIVFELIVP